MLLDNESEISEVWKRPKCCRKNLNSAKSKTQNYKTEQNQLPTVSTQGGGLNPLLWDVKQLGNCDIVSFVFCDCFCIMSPKFLKFERDQNVAEKNLNSAKSKTQNYKTEEIICS